MPPASFSTSIPRRASCPGRRWNRNWNEKAREHFSASRSRKGSLGMQHLRARTRPVESDPRQRAMSSRQSVERLVASGEPVALFLDIDGTLLDVALTPSTVHVPPVLPDLLDAVSVRL